ncbi:MAG: IclR family transcriptional regulator [Hyphomicrobiaceae bacterium]|nr:IclR family transcriptional regulator [Hyphomicrobiaceae bacterium]
MSLTCGDAGHGTVHMREYSQNRALAHAGAGDGVQSPRPGDAPQQASTGPGRRRDSVQSVERALALVDVLARSAGSLQLTELVQQAQLNISTGHHLLATLVKWGYVARSPGRRYALGARGLHLAQAFLKQVDLPRRAQPHVDRIGEETGETVRLAVLQSDAVVTLLKHEGRHAVRVEAGEVGSVDAAHATALGKAMLAWLPEQEIRRILATRGMAAFTPNTFTDADLMIEELRLVRRHGHAVDREEYQPGVTCIGAAVRNHLGAVVGAISASAPSSRANEQHLALMRDSVMGAARALAVEFGEEGPQPTPAERAHHA